MVGSAFAFIDPDWESERIREHFQQRGHPELTEAILLLSLGFGASAESA